MQASAMGLTGRLLALILLLAAAVLPAAAESRRVALVIGNGDYEGLVDLRNPTVDASDMAAVLTSLGFEVTLVTNAGQSEMSGSLARFAQDARDAEASLVYYAGHGIQVRQVNYLVPVDAEIRSEDDVVARTVSLDSILSLMQGAGGIKIVLLDACQNNPLPPDAAVARVDGLARVGTMADFLVSFATQPGEVAYDGLGRNSPFARALLTHMNARGLEVLDMLTQVNTDVNTATGGLQVPYVQFSSKPAFFFAPGEPDAIPPEVRLWQVAAGERDPNLLQIYLQRYPSGAHAADAQALLSEVGTTADPGTFIRGTGGEDTVIEDTLWQLGREGRNYALVDLYLARYPEGRYVEEAKSILATLTPPNDPNEPSGTVCERLATHERDATANVDGVPLARLAESPKPAIDACSKAVAQHPEVPHYKALLARALVASGDIDGAVRNFQAAAEGGDLRAMVSLGLLSQNGTGLPKDLKAAIGWYEKAAAGGSPDGAINLAVALIGGKGVPKDVPRAIALLQKASAQGSGIATFNLGQVTDSGLTGTPADAIALFRKSTEQGYYGGHLAAAKLLDEGRGVSRDPAGAAGELLAAVMIDAGEAIAQLTDRSMDWAPETIKAVQQQLLDAGYYTGAVDGRAGPKFAAALKQWRLLGPPLRS